jgi:hypothetical protein
MVDDAPRFEQVLERLDVVLRGRPVVIYNVAYDTRLIAQSCASPFQWWWLPRQDETLKSFSDRTDRGARVTVGDRGTLREILVGPAHENDGKRNLFGGLQMSMATTGYSDVKEFQKAEVMIAPSLQTEGKSLQSSQQVGMG